MKKELFFVRFLKNPLKIGAVFPSSRFLATRMIEKINFKTAKVIIEYGPGTGVFTKELLKHQQKETLVVLIESDPYFYQKLVEKYSGKKNIIVIHSSAENVEQILKDLQITQVDYIISGLPFASLPKSVTQTILEKTKRVLKTDGYFITFQYTLYKLADFKKYFPSISLKKEYRNLPSAYILSCINKK